MRLRQWARCSSVAQFHEQPLDDLPLPGRPVLGLAELGWGLRAFGQARALFEPHAIITQIGKQTAADLRGALDSFAMGVKPVASFLGFRIRHPDLFGRAGQVGLADAHRADFVIVGVGFLELAQVTTLQDQSLAPNGSQRPNHLKAVARSLQHHQVPGGGVLLGPALELGHRHFVKHLFGHRLRRSLSSQHGGRKGVRVSIQANHPLDSIRIFVHHIS